MISRLPLTVALFPDECATSYASRLARRNGVPRLITFCSDLGIDYFELVNGHPTEIERLAFLGGVDQELLQRGTPKILEPGWFRLAEERIKFTAFNRTAFRCCPACASDSEDLCRVSQLGVWQLSSIRLCAVHGCYLEPLPKAPNVNDTFDFTNILGNCTLPAPTAAQAGEEALSDYLRHRVMHGAGDAWHDRLPFHVASQTCEMFGLLLTRGPNVKRDELSHRGWACAGAAGFHVLERGPDAFLAALKDVQLGQPMDNGSHRSRMRVFFEWLRYRDDDPGFDVIRDLVRDFVFANYPVAEGQVVLGQPCPEQMVHSMASAKRTYGISNWRLGRRLEAIGLARRSASGQQYVLDQYVPTQIVQDIVTEATTLLNATDAGKWLGIDRITVASLTKKGLISRYYQDANTAPLYHPDELRRFVSRLRALTVRDVPQSGDVDLPTAARRTSIPIANLIGLILQSEIPLRTGMPASAGFRSFKISLQELRAALAGDLGSSVTPAQAADLMGVNLRTVRALLKMGLLDGKDAKDPATDRARRHVCRASIERFKAEHITLAELAAPVGDFHRIEPVAWNGHRLTLLPMDCRCTKVFRREELTDC